jgi:hypothetical protein
MNRIIAITALIALAGCGDPQPAALPNLPAEYVPMEIVYSEWDDEADAPLPNIQITVFGGTLLGSDAGEFGGKLAFQDAEGRTFELVQENVQVMLQRGGEVIVITGLSHMATNYGRVWLVSASPGGEVSARLLHQLPGAPRNMGMSPSTDAIWFTASTGGLNWLGRYISSYECSLLDRELRLMEVDCPAGGSVGSVVPVVPAGSK